MVKYLLVTSITLVRQRLMMHLILCLFRSVLELSLLYLEWGNRQGIGIFEMGWVLKCHFQNFRNGKLHVLSCSPKEKQVDLPGK